MVGFPVSGSGFHSALLSFRVSFFAYWGGTVIAIIYIVCAEELLLIILYFIIKLGLNNCVNGNTTAMLATN